MVAASEGSDALFFLCSLSSSAVAVLFASQVFVPALILDLQLSQFNAASSQLLTLMLNVFSATFKESLKRFF